MRHKVFRITKWEWCNYKFNVLVAAKNKKEALAKVKNEPGYYPPRGCNIEQESFIIIT